MWLRHWLPLRGGLREDAHRPHLRADAVPDSEPEHGAVRRSDQKADVGAVQQPNGGTLAVSDS